MIANLYLNQYLSQAGFMTESADRIPFNEPYREKAARREIDGPYKDGAREVRRLLGWEVGSKKAFLSTRAAQNKTNISFGTINSMANGSRVSESTVELFALRIGTDPKHLKRLFGHLDPEEIIAPQSDLLSRIGPDVNVSAITNIRLSPFAASAGDGFVPPDPGLEYETFESVLPGQIRAIRVTGDCMEPLYQDGDVVFVREQGNAESGNKVVACVDGDKIYCKVYRTNGTTYLEPKNGEGKIPASRFNILGVIVGVFRKED